MTEQEAIVLARRLLDEHKLFGWEFKINRRAKRRLGLCKHRHKIIEVSAWCFEHCPDKVENTIRHEVAHAIVGPGHGHGHKWKMMAIAVGAEPKACTNVGQTDRDYKWCTICADCGNVTSKNFRRRSQRTLSRRVSNCCKAKIVQKELRV